MGLPIGMLLGLAVGIAKDKRSNGQENVAVSKDNMKTQEFEVGDLAYMDADGGLGQAAEKNESTGSKK